MKIDTSQYKPRIMEYLQKKGVKINTQNNPPLCQCPNHEDNNPSAIIYEENIYCPVCCATYDIFETAGLLDGVTAFQDKIKSVQSTLGITEIQENNYTPTPKKSNPKNEGKPVVLSVDKAREIFTSERFLQVSKYIGKGDPKKGLGDTITGVWPFKTESGDIEIIDVRFEGGTKKKNVVSFYYDGQNVKSKNCPVKVFNKDLIVKYPNHKILIVEGCKSAEKAHCLLSLGFVPVTWNRGTANALNADWSIIEGRTVDIFPDDDEPGLKVAKQLQGHLEEKNCNVKIIPPIDTLRKIKPQGADIVEALEKFSPENLVDYIEKSEPYNVTPQVTEEPTTDTPAIETRETSDRDYNNKIFRILGVAEDDNAYFMDRHQRLYNTKLEALNKNKLLRIAPLSYWLNMIGSTKLSADDWLTIQDDIMQLAGEKDFSVDDIRGRGAWKESNGDLCFHDGSKTHGNPSPDKIFLKKSRIDIGFNSKPIDATTIENMKKACFALSFDTQSDAMRLLSWSILAPFSGALDWRPQAFLTGGSGSGKSSVEQNVVKPLAIPERMNGGDTSAAGYTQARRGDSGGVVIEEMDPDTEKKKNHKDDLLSIMRQSTSDDTPKAYKGTADQTGKSYTSRDMFLFVAISPEVESVADDNRLVKVNLSPSKDGIPWREKKANLKKYMTEENCRAIRNMTWQRLNKIIELSEEIAELIQDHTGKDHRFAISEGTLMAAYITVWKGETEPSEEYLKTFVEGNYELIKPEETRDEVQELIDRILEYKVKVYGEKVKEYNVLEVLKIIDSGEIPNDEGIPTGIEYELKQEFKRSINNIGISLDPDGNLAIANNHQEIKRIAGRSNGYAKVLKRHKDLVDSSKNVVFIDKTRKCTTISGIVQNAQVPF